jgi:hypothetical protein
MTENEMTENGVQVERKQNQLIHALPSVKETG